MPHCRRSGAPCPRIPLFRRDARPRQTAPCGQGQEEQAGAPRVWDRRGRRTWVSTAPSCTQTSVGQESHECVAQAEGEVTWKRPFPGGALWWLGGSGEGPGGGQASAKARRGGMGEASPAAHASADRLERRPWETHAALRAPPPPPPSLLPLSLVPWAHILQVP